VCRRPWSPIGGSPAAATARVNVVDALLGCGPGRSPRAVVQRRRPVCSVSSARHLSRCQVRPAAPDPSLGPCASRDGAGCGCTFVGCPARGFDPVARWPSPSSCEDATTVSDISDVSKWASDGGVRSPRVRDACPGCPLPSPRPSSLRLGVPTCCLRAASRLLLRRTSSEVCGPQDLWRSQRLAG
jgi:hypothetical protein